MRIELSNGIIYEGMSNSTIDELIIMVSDIDEFVSIYNAMTNENLSEITIDGDTYNNRTLHETKTYKSGHTLEAHFVLLPQAVQGRIEELEALVLSNSDKADGYDILTGGI